MTAKMWMNARDSFLYGCESAGTSSAGSVLAGKSRSVFSALRRYSNFLWLYETLSANNPEVVFPPVPEKIAVGRFDDQPAWQRRLALERCIQRTANHPVLEEDPDLKLSMAPIRRSVVEPRFYEIDEIF